MLTSEPQWVAVYTSPRAEKQVEHNMRESGFEVYLPLRKELHKWSDRKKWVEVPLIKSYIFVKITKVDEDRMRKVKGVSYVVKFENEVATIPESEIQLMKDFLAAETDVQVRNISQLRRGTWVRVQSGYLEGRIGMLVSDCEEGNFAVEITGISMAMVIHVEKDMLVPISDDEIPVNVKKSKQYNIR